MVAKKPTDRAIGLKQIAAEGKWSLRTAKQLKAQGKLDFLEKRQVEGYGNRHWYTSIIQSLWPVTSAQALRASTAHIEALPRHKPKSLTDDLKNLRTDPSGGTVLNRR